VGPESVGKGDVDSLRVASNSKALVVYRENILDRDSDGNSGHSYHTKRKGGLCIRIRFS